MQVTGIILAGGKSRRMGRDKSTLELVAGLSLLDSVEQALLQISDDVIVVNNKDERVRSSQVREVTDVYVGGGPLAGIHAGLQAARHETAFVVACDMPFIDLDLINYLLAASAGYDVTILRDGDRLEALHAVYRKSALPVIERSLAEGSYKVTAILSQLQVNYIDVETIAGDYDYQRILTNINRPEDYEAAIERLSSR